MKSEEKFSVVYIDDDLDLLVVVKRSLGIDENVTVETFSDGIKAIEYLRLGGYVPDLILLDLLMPNVDGVKVFNVLNSYFNGNVPVIFFTSQSPDLQILDLISIGAIGVIYKPFDPLSLSAKLRRIVDNYRSK